MLHSKCLSLLVVSHLLARVSSLIFGQRPRCDTSCPYMYVPVCGSDGRSYPNLCFLYAASCWDNNLTFVRPGPCADPDPCNIPCNRLLYPVCGSNGVTYQNPCLLMLADCLYVRGRIDKVHDGRCNTTNHGTFIPRPRPVPVTPSTTSTTTPPSSRKKCPFGCTREYLPVCGSDGVTYPNDCAFNMVACKDPSLTIVKEGVCTNQPILPPTMSRCPLSCNKVYKPVCGSDGVTYVNMCLLTRAMCDDPTITKVKDGPCQPFSFTTESPSTRRPIILEKPAGGVNITPNREFCRKDCPFSYEPICGTDGVTYTNKCTFDVAVCVDASLKADYNGNCI